MVGNHFRNQDQIAKYTVVLAKIILNYDLCSFYISLALVWYFFAFMHAFLLLARLKLKLLKNISPLTLSCLRVTQSMLLCLTPDDCIRQRETPLGVKGLIGGSIRYTYPISL